MNLKGKSIIAITGPSGVGKTTLGDKLEKHKEISIPRHCTTRKKRSDDREGFYRYLSHEEYKKLLDAGEFLLSSGDGPTVSKEYGNFYGVLKNDCIDAWIDSDIIILFVSYKDISTLIDLRNHGLNIDIINLRFNDIENGIINRLTNDANRNHTMTEVNNRVNSAIADNSKYGEAIKMYAKCIVYTDVLSIEETYEKVCDSLKIRRLTND